MSPSTLAKDLETRYHEECLKTLRLFSLQKTKRNVVSDFRILRDCHSMKGEVHMGLWVEFPGK